MVAFKGLQNQEAVEKTGQDVVALSSDKHFSLDTLFKLAGVSKMEKHDLNDRQRRVVQVVLQALKSDDRHSDIVIDVAKSEQRAPKCINATSCIVPNSLPYRLQTQSILTAEQVHCVQGIYIEDFPALTRYAREHKSLTRDLAGNAFSTTVCMAVVICCLLHAPLRNDITSAPATPLRPLRALRMLSPSPVKRKRMPTSESPPLKRSKCYH